MVTFDATVNFDEPLELEHALTQVTRTIGDFEALTVIIRHDSDIGEVYRDEESFLAPVDEQDWCVTGKNPWDVAAQLRALV